LAKELNVDIVPFGIKGAYEIYPPHKKLPKSGTVKIKFFEKVSVKDYTVEELVNKNFETIKKWVENK
jgi:long-chain acyl-CoA synthetase